MAQTKVTKPGITDLSVTNAKIAAGTIDVTSKITGIVPAANLPTITVAKGGTNIASFAAGDLLYATGSTTLAKLNKGTAEQVLAMNSGATAPDWGSVDLTVLPTITVAKGGTNIASFVAGDILYATGTTTLAKLAKGAATNVLTMNAGATAPEWAAAAAGGSLSLLSYDVLDDDASIEYISELSNTDYDNYFFTFKDIVPITSGANFGCQVSLDGGSSWKTTWNEGHLSYSNSSDTAYQGYAYTNDTFMMIGKNLANDADEGMSGGFWIWGMGDSGSKTRSTSLCQGTLPSPYKKAQFSQASIQTSTDDMNAIRFLMSSGNLQVGSIGMYGVKKI